MKTKTYTSQDFEKLEKETLGKRTQQILKTKYGSEMLDIIEKIRISLESIMKIEENLSPTSAIAFIAEEVCKHFKDPDLAILFFQYTMASSFISSMESTLDFEIWDEKDIFAFKSNHLRFADYTLAFLTCAYNSSRKNQEQLKERKNEKQKTN